MDSKSENVQLGIAELMEQWQSEKQSLMVKRDALDAQINEADRNIEACERVLELDATRRREQFEGNKSHGHVDIGQLAACATQMDAAELIAQSSEGVVRVSDAGRMIHAAGLSRGKVSSVIATLSARMGSGVDWEYVEPGTFRFLRYVKRTDEEEGETCPEECYPTDGDGELLRTSQESEVTPVEVGRIIG